MRIMSVETAGFGKLPDGKIHFAEGLTVIKGPNEAGKSFTIRAICQGLYGDAATTDRKVREYCRKWGSEGDFFVRLELEENGKRVIITRNYQERRNVLHAEGQKEIRDKKKIAQRVGELLGLPTEKAFLATACIRQEEVEALDEEKPSIRSIIEEKIAGSGSDTEKLLRRLRQKMEGLRSKSGKKGRLVELEAELRELEEELVERRERIRRLAENRRELARVSAELEEGKRLLSEKEKVLENNRKYMNALKEVERWEGEFDRAQRDLDRCREAKRAMGELRESIQILEKELEEVTGRIERAEKFAKADAAWTDLAEEVRRLEERFQRIRELEESVSALQKQVEGMPAVDPADLRRAVTLPGEISSLETFLEAQLFGVEVKVEGDTAYAITADGVRVDGSRAEAHREAVVEFPGVATVHFKNLTGRERPLVDELAEKREALERILEK